MFLRNISIEEVKQIIKKGRIIKSYPKDSPYPSYLILGFIVKRPIHIVIAFNNSDKICIIITVYEPDPEQWENNFMRRIEK